MSDKKNDEKNSKKPIVRETKKSQMLTNSINNKI